MSIEKPLILRTVESEVKILDEEVETLVEKEALYFGGKPRPRMVAMEMSRSGIQEG